MEVWDVDENDQDYVGAAAFELAHVMARGKKGFSIDVTDKGSKRGTVFIKFEKLAKELNEFFIDFCASKVKNIEWFSKSDPFLRLYRPTDQYLQSNSPQQVPQNQWVMVKETHYVKDNLNPDFRPFTITGAKLCKNYLPCQIKLEIWDHSKRGKHTLISTGFFCVNDMIEGRCSFIDTADKKGKFSGKVILEKFRTQKVYSMVDFMNGGMQLALYTAIDFTGSNGVATSNSSLHYMSPNGQPNQYENAIMTVGSILQNYDSDKQIPVFGFGASYPNVGINTTSHCFPLSGQAENPYAV